MENEYLLIIIISSVVFSFVFLPAYSKWMLLSIQYVGIERRSMTCVEQGRETQSVQPSLPSGGRAEQQGDGALQVEVGRTSRETEVLVSALGLMCLPCVSLWLFLCSSFLLTPLKKYRRTVIFQKFWLSKLAFWDLTGQTGTVWAIIMTCKHFTTVRSPWGNIPPRRT